MVKIFTETLKMKDLVKKLEDLLEQVLELSKSGQGESEILKSEIVALKEFIQRCLDAMDEQFLSGFDHGIVLRSWGRKIPLISNNGPSVGSSVYISHKSSFYKKSGYPTTTGRINELDPGDQVGWALVEFNNKKTKLLRYGNPVLDDGFSDLVFLDDTKETHKDKDFVTVLSQGRLFDLINIFEFSLEVGDTVLINPRNNVLIGKTESVGSGVVSNVVEVDDDGLNALVSVDGSHRMVLVPKHLDIKEDDRVVLDSSMSIILREIPRTKGVAISSDIEPVDWEDVIGLERAKEETIALINQIVHPDLYESYGSEPAKGMLLTGDPGNGKTHFGKAVATKISRDLGAPPGKVKGFLYIKATEILDMFVGEAPRKVRDIFARARQFHEETGHKMIIFIDEVDAVLKVRGGNTDSGSSDSITNAFLTEMDGIQDSHGFVIGATNRPDLLDPAATRPGRLDHKIKVERPKEKDVPDFFRLFLKKVKLKDLVLDEAVIFCTQEYLSEEYALFDLYYGEERESFNLLHIGSGAMIETIINNAKRYAVARDIKLGAKSASGVSVDDIKRSFQRVYEESKLMRNSDAIKTYLESKDRTPDKVEPRV